MSRAAEFAAAAALAPAESRSLLLHLTELHAVRERMDACTACDLHVTASRRVPITVPVPPFMPLAVVGEAPGVNEDRQGVPFVGLSGALLDGALSAAGLERRHLYVFNTIGCRPPRNDFELARAAGAPVRCHDLFTSQLNASRSWMVLAMGNVALHKFAPASLTMTAARKSGPFWSAEFGRLIVPTWHPAYALRGSARDKALIESQIRADVKLAARILTGAESTPAPDAKYPTAPAFKFMRGGLSESHSDATRRKFDRWWKDRGFVPLQSPIVGPVLVVRTESTPVDAAYASRPTYTLAEVEIIRNSAMTWDDFRRLHALKVEFKGAVVR